MTNYMKEDFIYVIIKNKGSTQHEAISNWGIGT